MIAVIADDLTGAAEIGGIGLRYGLNVEIASKVDPASMADLLIINTDSRSKDESEAVAAVAEACGAIKSLQTDLIFKKIDSVLRGHVLAELEAEMKILGKQQALVIPANPHLGRTVVNELYLINGVPAHETSFATDPEFPINSAHISHMLRVQDQEVVVKKHGEELPEAGIIIGEVATADDLAAWAKNTDAECFLAGSSSFFSAIIDLLPRKVLKVPLRGLVGKPVLYVSGTTFSTNALKIKDIYNAGGPVSYMPPDISQSPGEYALAIDEWANEVSAHLRDQGRAIIGIDQSAVFNTKNNALAFRQHMALGVEAIFKNVKFEELVIEGGSTAAAILNRLNISTLFPIQEFLPGIIRSRVMYPQIIHVTLKPGSYPWSEKIWTF